MIEKETWIKNLLTELKILADLEFQKRVWVEGKTKEPWESWSNWVESMCGLYDDCFFNDLLDKSWHYFNLSVSLHLKLLKLREALNNFQEPDDSYNNKAIVYHPDWYPITLLAKDALIQLEAEIKDKKFDGAIDS